MWEDEAIILDMKSPGLARGLPCVAVDSHSERASCIARYAPFQLVVQNYTLDSAALLLGLGLDLSHRPNRRESCQTSPGLTQPL